jgi:hypothetical protein
VRIVWLATEELPNVTTGLATNATYNLLLRGVTVVKSRRVAALLFATYAV